MTVHIAYREHGMTQQDYLKAAKAELGVEWDALAELAGIKPRALKTYRMPPDSGDYRNMPDLAKAAIERVLEAHRKRQKRAKKGA